MRKLAIVIIFSCLGMAAFAQKEHRFEKEIAAYEQQDRQHAPLKGGIVFTGSSSIRMWKDLNDRFEGYNIIPRGFGGSQLSDVIYFADRILIPYRPSKIFLYAGDNDLAAGQTPDEVYQEFLQFYALITSKLPETKVYYIAAKPSIRRQKLMTDYIEFNDKVAKFIEGHPCNWEFVDVFSAMLNKKGEPMDDIFLEDNLHMNSKGYDIWEKLIAEYL